MTTLEQFEEKARKEIPNLEQKVHRLFSRTAANLRANKLSIALKLAEAIEDHDILTYAHSLRTCIQTYDIIDFVRNRAKRGDITDIPISELLAKKPDLLPKPGIYGSLLHDVGKIEIDKRILNIAYTGEAYTAKDRLTNQQHPQKGFKLLTREGEDLLITAWVADTHHLHQNDPYPNELPPRPSVNLTTHALIDFISRMVAIADRYDSLERVAISRGRKQLSQKEAQEYLIARNRPDESLIRLLYKNKVFS